MNYIDQTSLVFRKLFGDYPIHIDRIAEGVMNEKYRVEFTNKNYLIRFYLVDGNKKLKYEPAIINRLRKEGAKVPKVISSSLDIPNINGDYIIYEWIPGESVSSFLKTNDFYDPVSFIQDVVQNLKIISSLELDGFGELESGTKAGYDSFKSFLTDKIRNGVSYLYDSEFSSFYSISKIENFFNKFLNQNFNTRPNLIWSDMSFDNMIISNESLQSFIDFEYLYSGDRRMTLGYFFSKCGNIELASEIIEFFKSNDPFSVGLEESLVFYSLLRFVILSKYSNTSLPNGNSRKDFFEVFPGIRKSLSEFGS